MSGDIDFPEFTTVGLVDEEQFVYFDSNTKKVVPKTEWMKQKEGADYWTHKLSSQLELITRSETTSKISSTIQQVS